MASFVNYIERCYRLDRYESAEYTPRTSSRNNASNNNTNQQIFKINISGDKIFIPCYCIKAIEESIIQNFRSENSISEVLLPLYVNNYRATTSFKGSTPLIKLFFNDTYSNELLAEAKCNDVTFYGGHGIILYKTFEPMIIMGIEAIKSTTVPLKYDMNRLLLYINPKVYNTEETLSKYIRNKFLTCLMDLKFNSNMYYRRNLDTNIFTDSALNYNFEIEVTDRIKDFIIKPTLPTVNSTSDSINDYLVQNLGEVMNFYDFK